MTVYNRVGVSLFVGLLLVGAVFIGHVIPLVVVCLTATCSVTYYVFWTRGLAEKYVYLAAPIFVAPFAFFVYKTENNPGVYLSQILAMALSISINMILWGERAFAKKHKNTVA